LESKTYRVSTLGCRVNKADSLAIEKELAARGFRRADPGEVPTLWVVNTCAVTGEGMRKSRKMVRRCAKSGAPVLVTGCGADMDPEAFVCAGVLKTVPNSGKGTLAVEALALLGCSAHDGPPADWAPEELVRVPVKVQEGCERYCTYCVVPYLRPPPSSSTMDSVLEEVRTLRAAGAGEVILCGIDLGSYREPGTGEGLDSLVEAVTGEAGRMWVRLSSIELNDVSDGLIGLLREDNPLCRHLHIPLQSADGRVLRDMGREYTPQFFRRRVTEIRELVPGLSVTTDVMVGFPGEGEDAFRSTRNELESTGYSRVHVFKYSRRPGTPAYGLGDPVDGATKYGRAAELREVARANALRFHEGFVGRIIPVLVEETMKGEPGRLFGRAESFAGVVFEGDAGLVGDTVDVIVEAADPELLRGRVSPGPANGSPEG
jgi:threonylcarbamoyladenosine tRNA methylthiotransferase MtaB